MNQVTEDIGGNENQMKVVRIAFIRGGCLFPTTLEGTVYDTCRCWLKQVKMSKRC